MYALRKKYDKRINKAKAVYKGKKRRYCIYKEATIFQQIYTRIANTRRYTRVGILLLPDLHNSGRNSFNNVQIHAEKVSSFRQEFSFNVRIRGARLVTSLKFYSLEVIFSDFSLLQCQYKLSDELQWPTLRTPKLR